MDTFKHILAFYGVMPLCLLMGVMLTLLLKAPQFKYMGEAFRELFQKTTNGQFSSFAAVATVLGGNLGTGNIAGVAVALGTGGPGALFWMMVMAFFGMILKYAGCVLGILYRLRGGSSRHVGGPMYYLRDGLGHKKLSMIFAALTLMGALSVGNLVQMNSIVLPLITLDAPPILCGFVMSFFVAVVLFGGMRRFSILVTKLVPIMAIFYMGMCLIVLLMHMDQLPTAILMIFKGAFFPSSILGGIGGYALMHVIQSGFDRGLFATDAGVGLAPIVHASVTKSPGQSDAQFAHAQGIISMVSPMIVMAVCLITGLVLLVTNTWADPLLESTNICVAAFAKVFGNSSAYLVTATLILFGFTTMLTWSFCADRAAHFLFGYKGVPLFRVLFISLIPLGTWLEVKTVWILGDLSMNLMFLLNMIGLYGMRKKVVHNLGSLYP